MSTNPSKTTATKPKPGWVGPLTIIAGFIAIILGIVALFYPVGTVLTVTYIFLIAMIILGLVSIFRGLVDKSATSGRRTLEIIFGIIVFALAAAGLFYPGWSYLTILWIVAFAIMIYGFQLMFLGFLANEASGGMRALMVILGIITIIIASTIFWSAYVGVAFTVIFFSLALIFIGISLIVNGLRK